MSLCACTVRSLYEDVAYPARAGSGGILRCQDASQPLLLGRRPPHRPETMADSLRLHGTLLKTENTLRRASPSQVKTLSPLEFYFTNVFFIFNLLLPHDFRYIGLLF